MRIFYLFSPLFFGGITLRRLVKCESTENMEEILGIRSSSKKIASKSILRANFDSRNFIVQDSSISKLNKTERERFTNKLMYMFYFIDKNEILVITIKHNNIESTHKKLELRKVDY